MTLLRDPVASLSGEGWAGFAGRLVLGPQRELRGFLGI